MKSFIKKFIIYFITNIFLLIIFLFGVVIIIEFGPSKTARNLFINSAMESSAGKFLVTLFFSKEDIKKIRKENSVEKIKEVTDASLISLDEVTDEIKIEKVSGSTYHGFMALVSDPSRVFVGTSGKYGKNYKGLTVAQMAQKYNAILAINGGGFEDAGGVGNGGTPDGIVIEDGNLSWGNLNTKYELIGFDKDNKLILGNMTGKEALEKNVRSALSFGPFLIVNGTPAVIKGTGSGLNPRTAIGQRKDGTVLLLVIDGRSASSLGASFEDLINIFIKYEAINAANLDGGSSTLMYYQDKYINNCASLYGPRNMPTSIIVR